MELCLFGSLPGSRRQAGREGNSPRQAGRHASRPADKNRGKEIHVGREAARQALGRHADNQATKQEGIEERGQEGREGQTQTGR